MGMPTQSFQVEQASIFYSKYTLPLITCKTGGKHLPQPIKKAVTENPLSKLWALEKLLISLPIPLVVSEGKQEGKDEMMQVNRVFSVFQLGRRLIQSLLNSKPSINVFGRA